jgi:phage shock protein A
VNEPADHEIEDAVIEDNTAIALPEPTPVVTDYTDSGLPTFDYVRDRIEGRIATSMGATELPEEAATTASLDEQLAAREQAGKDRLEQIRRTMRKD